MKTALLLVALCALTSGRIVYPFGKQQVQRMDEDDAFAFLEGLMQGLEVNPSNPGACATELQSLSGLLSEVVKQVESIAGGNGSWGTFAKEMGELIDKVEGFNSDCNFSGLISTLESFATPTGLLTLLKNAFNNLDTLKTDSKALENCPSDWETCGKNVGAIFRTLTGWNLNAQRLRSVNDAVEFFGGLVSGLQKNPDSPDACITNLNTLNSDFNQIISEVQKFLGGNVFVITTIIEDVKNIVAKLDGFAGDCNISGLEGILEGLVTPQGWQQLITNYIANSATINSDFEGVLKCSSDYKSCGQDIGTIFKLVLGWGI